MLRTFTPVKIQRLRPGLNSQTWVPEASMLTTRPPKPSTPRKDPVPIVQEARWAPVLVWTDAENLDPTGIRSNPQLLVRSIFTLRAWVSVVVEALRY